MVRHQALPGAGGTSLFIRFSSGEWPFNGQSTRSSYGQGSSRKRAVGCRCKAEAAALMEAARWHQT